VWGIFGHAVDVTDLVRSRRWAEALGERLSLAQAAGRIGTFERDLQTGEVTWTPELEALYGLPPGGFGGTFESWEETPLGRRRHDSARGAHGLEEAVVECPHVGRLWLRPARALPLARPALPADPLRHVELLPV
jgi:PAS domain-containing protein